ncbi:MAG: bacillithiol biosynthesis cysteine-adding enzyme BshC [Flavobacteriales bacterium]
MIFEKFPIKNTLGLSSIVEQFLQNHEDVHRLTHGAPTPDQILLLAAQKQFDHSKREVLVQALSRQYEKDGIAANQKLLDMLALPNSFTITTGHQLCLATGPLYFIYKIASAIALARKLNDEANGNNFIPVYWMASEDHDFEEINHFHLFNKKLIWNTDQRGAVGEMSLSGLDQVLEELHSLFRDSEKAKRWMDKLSNAYRSNNLAAATRCLVHEIFGQEELLIVDGNDVELKKLFYPVLLSEISERKSEAIVTETSQYLESKGLKAQVTPREVNLFFLEKGSRERIKFDGQFTIGNKSYSEIELVKLLNDHPEKYSPNVILRPVYQEFILPNIAYIGGPGELAYWHQLKGVFELYQTNFPALVLRDSALILSPGTIKKMNKLGLVITDLFKSQKEIIDAWMEADGLVDLTCQKADLIKLFDDVTAKAASVDATLHGFVQAEGKRQLNALENIEKKMTKAFKTREEQKINQLEKIWSEVYPDHQPQERFTNLSQYIDELPEDFIEKLIANFNPLQAELKVISLN